MKPGPKPSLEQVVGAAGGEVGRGVAGVGEPEVHVQRGQGEGDQTAEAQHDGRPRAALDDAAPAVRQRAAVAGEATADPGDVEPVDRATDEAEHGRQQRDGGEHHHEHHRRRADGEAAQEAEVHHEQPEQRDDDRAPGEEHGAAGRVDGGDDRRPRLEALVQGRPVAGDDEQHVVDADADADHRRHLRGEVGDLEHVGEQGDAAEPDAEAEQGDEDREAGGEDGAEADEQDDEGDEEADALGAELRLLGALQREPAELDLEAGLVDGRPLRDQRLAVLDGVVADRDVEAQGGVGDVAAGGDAPEAVEWRLDRLHVRRAGETGEDAVDRGARLGGVDAGIGAEDHVDLVAGVRREAGLEQVEGLLGLRTGRREREVVLAAERRAQRDRADEDHDPRHEHGPPAPVAPVGQAHQGGGVVDGGQRVLLRRCLR